MAQVNTSVWGSVTDWHNNGTYTTLDDKYKIKNTDEVIDLWQDNKLVVNTPWDKSLSYCGLGTESPLSHITFLRRVVPYYYESSDWDGSKFSDMIVDYIATDDRDTTNFAIGFTEIYSNKNQHSCQFKSDFTSLGLEQYAPIFQRWGPDSKADDAMQWIIDHQATDPDPWCNVASSVMFAQVPVKNFVAVPHIVCGNSINSKFLEHSGDLQTVDLKTYLTAEQEEGHEHASYLTHPYVFQVLLKFVYSGSDTNFESHVREGTLNPSTCFILDQTNMYSDINPDCVDDDQEGYDFTVANMYNQLMNWVSWSEGMPIMGLTSGPAGWYWRDGWQIGFGIPSVDVPLGTDMADLKDVHGRYNFPIWIGSSELETKIIQNENPQSYSEADDGCIIYYMSAGNDPEVFREKIRRATACFGLFFVDGMDDKDLALDDTNMMLGILENGIGHGNYSFGLNNRLQDQWKWDDMHEGDYDPTDDPEIDDDSSEDTKNKTVLPTRGMLMPFTGSYVFDYLPLTGVINACTHHYIDMQDAIEDWNLNKEEQEDSLDFESYLWRQWGRQANPVDCLQNITYYPFNIRPYMTGLTSTTVIQVGSFVQDYAGTGVVGSKVGATTTAGSIWCGNGENSGMKFPITNADDFRSYAPYVSATLYLPFCGSIELDPQVFVGHTIKVNYLVDWRTGVCLALVYRDNLVVEAVSGQMGNKVNLQMLDGTTWASQLANASVQESNAHFNRATNFFATVGGLVKIAAGAALIVGTEGIGTSVGGGLIANGVGSVANSFIKGNQIDVAENKAAYDIGTTPIPTRQISTASPAVNASNEMRVRLVVFKSEEEDKGNYAHTVGHACLKYGTLNNLNCTGYTVCQTIDTAGITATEAEKEKIRSLLMGGVYV